ncbi:MAG: hypothetical protein HOP16_20690 [Acidobacteria bacterium]|nr:hypothetical protein [Acidobacteriota bacterium]
MLAPAAATTSTLLTGRPRVGNRRRVQLKGRLTWRDAGGVLRFASVMTQDVSDLDAFVECQAPASIPLYRLVHFQLERSGQDWSLAPAALQHGKVLSAVYRVGTRRASTGTPQGYALRLLVDPNTATATRRRPMSMAAAN